MKKTLFFILMFLVACLTIQAETIVNPDKPAKGDWNFQPQKLWESGETGEDILTSGIRSIHIDANGDVYLHEGKAGRFIVFDAQGKFLRSFGRKGQGPGEIGQLLSFFLIGSNLIAAEMGKISYFDKEGKFLRSEPVEGIKFPQFFLDDHRFIYSGEFSPDNPQAKARVFLYDLQSKTEKTLAEFTPSSSGVNVQRSQGGESVVVMRIASLTPMMIVGGRDQRISFGFNSGYTLKTIDPQGKELLSFSLERPARPVSDTEKRNLMPNRGRPRIVVNSGGGGDGELPKEMLDNMIKGMPDTLTQFSGIHIDERGYYYLAIPEADSTKGYWYDIFSPQGKYLYRSRIQAPAGEQIVNNRIVFHESHLYLLCENEEGEIRLLKFKIALPV